MNTLAVARFQKRYGATFIVVCANSNFDGYIVCRECEHFRGGLSVSVLAVLVTAAESVKHSPTCGVPLRLAANAACKKRKKRAK